VPVVFLKADNKGANMRADTVLSLLFAALGLVASAARCEEVPAAGPTPQVAFDEEKSMVIVTVPGRPDFR
jgi:hypothetical protein